MSLLKEILSEQEALLLEKDTLAGFKSAHRADHPEDKQIYLKGIGYKEFKGILKMLNSVKAAKEFMKRFFPFIAEGGFRAVFRLSDKSVIKVAHDNQCLQENKREISMYSDLAPFAPMLIDHDPHGIWVEFEYIPPKYRSLSAFWDHTKIDPWFIKELGKGQYKGMDYWSIRENHGWEDSIREMIDAGANEKVLEDLVNKILEFGITDLHSNNIGYSPRTKMPVILDYAGYYG